MLAWFWCCLIASHFYKIKESFTWINSKVELPCVWFHNCYFQWLWNILLEIDVILCRSEFLHAINHHLWMRVKVYRITVTLWERETKTLNSSCHNRTKTALFGHTSLVPKQRNDVLNYVSGRVKSMKYFVYWN